MMFFVRFTINFCISFVILSIPVNEKAIFNHLYQLTGAVVSKKINAFKKRSKSYLSKKTKPGKNINQEKILSEFSKKPNKSQQFKPKEEVYMDEEQEIIRKALQKN